MNETMNLRNYGSCIYSAGKLTVTLSAIRADFGNLKLNFYPISDSHLSKYRFLYETTCGCLLAYASVPKLKQRIQHVTRRHFNFRWQI